MTPKLSICIPIHDTPQTGFFLSRLINSLNTQTFRDFEVVITNEGAMAHNHNAAINKAKGEIIRFIQMDDYLSHPYALQDIVDNFKEEDEWMITACIHTFDGVHTFNPHYPTWNDDMHLGNNTLGGISTLVIRNDSPFLFEEPLTWVVDVDLYQTYYDRCGPPKLLNLVNVVIDTRDTRLTSTLSDELKAKEVEYMKQKYDK